MQIYLVGGAVRDQLLGLPIKERDWVVVGATPSQMLALGFQPVGKEFPVFLHPETHEEYALARTERKTGKGYKGFTFHTDQGVTLEQDLARRDLTINAIAMDDEGNLIDPYHGQEDLKQKYLRHVSPAFQEDPVRILRVARFAARFTDFKIHADTLEFMRNMVKAGEVDALVKERVWQELQRALTYQQPLRFFTVLNDCDALKILFPELKLESAGMEKLAAAKTISDPTQRLALITHDLEVGEISTLAKRLHIPNNYRELMLLLAKLGPKYAELDLNSAENILQITLAADALRRKERFNLFLELCQLCFDSSDTKKMLLQKALTAILAIPTTELQKQNLAGQEFALQLQALRLMAIKQITSYS